MDRIMTIAKREVFSLFVTPIGYIVLFLFMLFMGILFCWQIFVPGQIIEIRTLVDWSRFSLFFVVPLMTMSLFADEYKSGRMEMLRTSPVTELQLLLGKFLGALCFYQFLVASTLVYLLLLMFFGRPDLGQVVSSYLGMFLMGFMFVAVGVFFSACTREQIVAALGGMITLGAFTVIGYFSASLPPDFRLGGVRVPVRPVVDYLGVGTHIADFSRGSVELTNITYFLGFAALFLFWTYLLLESRKWR